MNKIKKQFKDFWAYMRLLKYGANQSDKTSFRRFLPLIFAVTFGIIIILSHMSIDNSLRVTVFMPFLFGMSVATGIVTSFRPSLIGVAPYTPKQRIVFSYLATLLRAIIATVLWSVIMFVCMLLFALAIFMFTGQNIFTVKNEVYPAISAYGTAHSALVWVILVFAGYAIAHLNSRKARNISAVCVFAGLEILTLVLVNLCGRAEQMHNIATGVNDGLVQPFFISSDVSVTIDYLARPWVVIVVEGVLAAAAFAASLYASVMRYKSSKI